MHKNLKIQILGTSRIQILKMTIQNTDFYVKHWTRSVYTEQLASLLITSHVPFENYHITNKSIEHNIYKTLCHYIDIIMSATAS